MANGEVHHVHAKVIAVHNYLSPVAKKKTSIDFYVWWGCFCKNWSIIVALLTDLLRDREKFIWLSTCQLAFDDINSIL